MVRSCFGTVEERRAAFAAAGLYPVISSEYCAGRDPAEVFAAAVAGGAKVVQIREKNRDKGEIFRLVQACRGEANRRGALIIVDDHADVAMAAGADGVHVGQTDLPAAAVKAIAPGLLVGVSTHNAEEIDAAQRDGCDYLNIGPIFPTQTKTVGYPALGVERLKELMPRVRVPFTVMGGIKARHLEELIGLGARRIAMVTEVTQAEDVEGAVRAMCSYWVAETRIVAS